MTHRNLTSHIQGLQALEQARGCEITLAFNAVQAGEVRRLLPIILQEVSTGDQFPSPETLFLAFLTNSIEGMDGVVASDEAKRQADVILHSSRAAEKVKAPKVGRAARTPREKK